MHGVHRGRYREAVTELLTGRRQANKARTRAAILTTVYDMIDAGHFDDLTAERVAEAAGLSRRTFFNYFESVEAAVALGADDVLDRVRLALTQRPVGESPIGSAMAVVTELFTTDFLAEATRVWRAAASMPTARRYVLEAQADRAVDVTRGWGRERLDPHGADPLRAAVLTTALLGAFEEARVYWLATEHAEIDEEARAEFLALVQRALDIVRPALDGC